MKVVLVNCHLHQKMARSLILAVTWCKLQNAVLLSYCHSIGSGSTTPTTLCVSKITQNFSCFNLQFFYDQYFT